MDPRALMKLFLKEPPAFWFLCFYLMVEYVRPQQVWHSIDVLPWGEASLILTVLAYFFGGGIVRKFNVADGFLLLFTFIIVASSVTAYYPAAAYANWSLFINWLLVYFLVTHLVVTPRRYLLFLGFFLLWSLKMSQHGARTFIMRGGAFASWGATGGPGWFHNSGEFAIQMCIFLPLALYFVAGLQDHLKPWMRWGLLALLPGTAFLSLIASSSRGGQIGTLVVILYMIGAQSSKRVKGLLISAVVLASLWVIMPAEQKARFETMGEDRNSTRRLQYWKDGIRIMNDFPVLGIGYKNWIPYYRRHYDPTAEVQHNIFVEAGSEMGYSGLIGFLLLIGTTFLVNHRTRRLAPRVPGWERFFRCSALGLDAALVGYMVSGFFVTVLFYPFFWVNLAMTVALFTTTLRAAKKEKRLKARMPSSPHPHAFAAP